MDENIFEVPAKKKAENGTFGQIPHIVLYGLPDLPVQDKWALSALIGMAWLSNGKTDKEREGPYKLSTREISNITGIQHATLRSKEGKAPRVGVLDRLQETGYITFFDAKPIDPTTGKEGRMQTYLYVHLERIWKDNAKFVETWNKPAHKPALWMSYKEVTVDHDNSNIVDEDNTTVDVDSSDVDHDNVTVDEDNVTVDNVSSKSPTISSIPLQTFSKNTEVDPSLNQNPPATKKPITAYFLESYIKDLLKAAGEYWNRKEHTQRLVQIYLDCDLEDEEIFKDRIIKASNEAMMFDSNLEWFYQCLYKSLKLNAEQLTERI